MKYKVQHFQDNIYEVMENIHRTNYYNDHFYPPPATVKYDPPETWESVFQGTLSECEAWINLKEKGYM